MNIGQVVNYIDEYYESGGVAYEAGVVRPAFITRIKNEQERIVSLSVMREDSFYFVQDVPYSEDNLIGSWQEQ